MSARRAWPATGLLMLLLASATWAQQGPMGHPIVKPVGEPPYELYVADGHIQVLIPLTLRSDVRPDAVVIELVDVSLGGRRGQALIEAFTPRPRFEPSDAGLGPMLAMDIDPTRLREAATYQVLLRALHPRPDGGFEEALFMLPLVRPAAQVRASPEQLVIDSTYLLPCGLGSVQLDHELTRLTLAETSHRSGLAPMSFLLVSMNGPSEKPVDAKLVFTQPGSLDAGTETTVSYHVDGCFPLGRTSGHIEISAPEAKAPLVIPYEVKARLFSGYILFFLGLGIAAGHWMRIRSEQRIQLIKRQIELQQVGKRATELEERSDNLLHSQLAGMRQRLKEELPRADADKLSELIRKMNQDLIEFQQAFFTRRDALGRQLDAWNTLLVNAASLPAPVREVVDRLGLDMRKVMTYFAAYRQGEEKDMEKASKDCSQVEPLLRQALHEAMTLWVNLLTKGLIELSHHLEQFPPETRQMLQKEIDKLKGHLDAAVEDTLGKSLDELAPQLATARRQARRFISEMLMQLETIASLSAGLLEQLPPNEARRDAVAEVHQAHGKLATLRGSTSQVEPEVLVEEMLQHAKSLTETIRKATLQATGALSPEDEESFANLLSEGLVSAVAEFRYNRGLRGGESPKAPDSQGAGASVLQDVSGWREESIPVQSMPTSPFLAVIHRALSPEQQTEDSLSARLRSEQARRKLGAAIIIGFVSFFLFQETFTGTLLECLAIFAWGFGLDVGVEGVSQVLGAGKLRPS